MIYMPRNLKWIVVSGGPGMSNNYLRETLPKAFPDYNLHFYDAYGSPESDRRNVTIADMVGQIEELSSADGDNEFGLITHSFGNYLALKLLEKNERRLKAIIMLNPIPFTYDGWKGALDEVVNKIPANVMAEISNLSRESTQGKELFKLIYPYYIGRCSNVLPIDVPFDIVSCNFIADQLTSFNDLDLILNTTTPICRIVGEEDPFYKDIDCMADRTIVLNEVGHYPFFEDYNQFSNAVLKIEEMLCRTTVQTTIKYF